jgi:hypothetical protein
MDGEVSVTYFMKGGDDVTSKAGTAFGTLQYHCDVMTSNILILSIH